MKFKVFDQGSNHVNTIVASESFVQGHYPHYELVVEEVVEEPEELEEVVEDADE